MKRMKEIISVDAGKHLTKPNSLLWWSSVQFSHSIMFDSLWPLDCSTPGLPVHHQLPELAQTHVHQAGDAIQTSHPLLPLLLLPLIFLSIRVFSKESVLRIRWPKYWSSASVSVLPMNIQDWFRLGCTGWTSLLSKGLLRVFSNTTVQKQHFFGTQVSIL